MNKNEKGFSLIELLVAIGIFAVVVTITSGTFIVSLRGQRKTITVQNVADNARYAMETMAKEIRMMDVDLAFPASVSSTIPGVGPCPGSPAMECYIVFYSNMPNRGHKRVEFYLANGKVMFDDDADIDPPNPEPLTSANVQVTRLEFDDSGTPGADQPRITVVMQIESEGVAADVDTRMDIETTVSPRTL